MSNGPGPMSTLARKKLRRLVLARVVAMTPAKCDFPFERYPLKNVINRSSTPGSACRRPAESK